MNINSEKLAKSHYENFPVIPFFLPREWRKPIALIYAFARTADDYADEGDFTPEIRLQKLDIMAKGLSHPNDDFFDAIANLIKNYKLPINLFYDLLNAFKQDIVKTRYQTEEEILAYCRLSAHPIGRLLLHLTGNFNQETALYSDKICASLQLINFSQDFHSDLIQRNRIYIPQDDLDYFHVNPDDLRHKISSPALEALLHHQWQRAAHLLKEGTPLLSHLKGRFHLMIALTVAGGSEILQRLNKQNAIFNRPVLSKVDWITLTFKTIKTMCEIRPSRFS